MKAAVFYQPHAPVSIEELEIQPPQADEVLLDIVGAGCLPQRLPLCRWARQA